MPQRFIVTAWPGEYGPNVVIDLRWPNSSRSRAWKATEASRATV